MKFSCTQENFSQSLDLVTPITGKNLSLPILNNVLICISNGEIQFSSTNLEIAVTSKVRGKIESEGKVTVNGKLLRDFISLQSPGKIQFEVKDGDAHITSPSSKTVIKGTPAEEFPVIPTVSDRARRVSVDMPALKKALYPVIPAITITESRPEISGVLFSFKPHVLVIVGTDSYRLAEYSLPLQSGSLEGSFIIPLRTIQEIVRVFPEGTTEFVFTENQLLCQNESVEIVSRLIEGSYPDYKQIIPQEEKTTISISRDECLQAVKTASLFCKAGVNDIELSTKKDEKLLVVVAANNQVGENITTLPAVITGDDTSVIFNYRYMLDALSTIETDDALIALNGQNAAGTLRPADSTPLLHLIMPIRQ